MRIAVVMGLVSGSGLVACGDAGPAEDFDPRQAETAVTNLVSAVTTNPAVQSIAVLESAFELPAAAPANPHRSATAPTAEIPVLRNSAGDTFVYDPSTERYARDGAATGAPSNGVRFVLYQVNDAEATVAVPLTVLGELDLTDESTESTVTMRARATTDGATSLDYQSTAAGSPIVSTLVLSTAGLLADGSSQIDFDISQSFSQSDGFDVTYSISDNAAEVLLRTQVDAQTQIVTTTLTVTTDGSVSEIMTTGTEDAIEGTVRHNGSTVLEISGSAAAPVFVATDGLPPSGTELVALLSLFTVADDLFVAFDDVLAPAYFVYDLGVIFGRG